MAKIEHAPQTMIYPLPAVLVSCGTKPSDYNIITIAWTGIICSNPAMCYISVRPHRHSYEILRSTLEFVINLTSPDLLREVDWCGTRTGRKFNKFKETGLTPGPGLKVSAPIIQEAPLHLECKVQEIKPLGAHDMFISNIVGIQADENLTNKETGKIDLTRASFLTYVNGQYHELGSLLNQFGFSARKRSG